MWRCHIHEIRHGLSFNVFYHLKTFVLDLNKKLSEFRKGNIVRGKIIHYEKKNMKEAAYEFALSFQCEVS